MTTLSLPHLIPGGILPGDHLHARRNDGTCSRCRSLIADDAAPLMVWIGDDGNDLLIYCETCLREEPPPLATLK